MSLSLVSSSYLEENSAKIRAKPVPWEGYQRAGLITSEELSLIKKVDRQPKAKTESLLLSESPTYALLYLQLLKKLQRVDTMQSILVLIADSVSDHDERIPLFTRAVEVDPELPYHPLLRLAFNLAIANLKAYVHRTLETQDDFVQLKAAQILTVLLCSESTLLQPTLVRPFLATLSNFVQGSAHNKCDIAVQCLEALLARPECRQAIWEIPGIIAGLVEILKHNPSPQMSYQVAFCLWLLSFEQNVAEEINKRHDIIPLLTSVAQAAVKEKVIRVIVATFRNLVSKAPQANLPAMLVAQLLPFAKNLCSRKWSDEDIVEDVQFLRDELTANFQSLTTYDEYSSQLTSGHLSWTPVHESEDFWKENAIKLNDKDCEQLKILVKLLQESTDPLVLAVAAHDIGQYVKHCDKGKKLATNLGAKTRVMELMTHANSDVRYRALLSVQQLVSQSWVTV
ncbi:V-type proton ATPase subunit H [Mycena indigotica]|uniref:V-type proton ATPase subunit H n=1 Tax=Mycena indigotica TaxID=2126181 RepID=A0A8H6S968_9AGAR|nr:V-type proton ATPase subunit H [Mycena indigotica]KAF7295144.1 V-type proton ATPase subunit H [Mycena indigotica]